MFLIDSSRKKPDILSGNCHFANYVDTWATTECVVKQESNDSNVVFSRHGLFFISSKGRQADFCYLRPDKLEEQLLILKDQKKNILNVSSAII